MKKHLFTWKTILILTSFSLSPLAYTDTHTTEIIGETEEPSPQLEFVSPQEPYGDLNEEDEAEDDEEPQGTPVTQSTNSAAKAKKKEFWKNIILASAAVIVAIVSILVVSND